MKQKRKEKMNNQSIYTYGQSNYLMPKSRDVWVISSDKNLKNFSFEEGNNYKPTLLLLKSIVKAQEDREAGKASPIFSSVSEMKRWIEEQHE